MEKHVTEQKIVLDHPLSKQDWSLLPKELLHLISTLLENFEVIHARSVCSSWRSSFPFPSYLLRLSHPLPKLDAFKYECLSTLVKVPLFLCRVLTPLGTATSYSEYFLASIRQDDRMELFPSPVQCSVRSDRTMNVLDCQMIPLGHQYRMVGWDLQQGARDYRNVAYLPLNQAGGGEFVVFRKYSSTLFVLKSAEMRWAQFKKISNSSCVGLTSFRGRFYVLFGNGDHFVIDPYSLEATRLTPPSPHRNLHNYMVPCGSDELFFVEKNFRRLTCRVSRLDEEAGKWVVVNDLGDRVLLIGRLGNLSFSAKELPDGCGVSGNSILFTHEPRSENFFYKYGVNGNLSLLRFLRKNRVMIFNKSFPVLAIRVQC